MQQHSSRRRAAADLARSRWSSFDAQAETHLVYHPRDGNTPNAAFIVLHGLDDNPESAAKALAATRQKRLAHAKWVHLRAPERPITCYGGKLHRAFGDFVDPGILSVKSTDYRAKDGHSWYMMSTAMVHDTIKSLEVDDSIPTHRIYLVGFSQGAAVAAEAAFTLDRCLGGLVMIAGWLTPRTRRALDQKFAPAKSDLNTIIAHGSCDEQVDYGCGVEACRLIASAVSTVRFICIDGSTHVDSFTPAVKLGLEYLRQEICDTGVCKIQEESNLESVCGLVGGSRIEVQFELSTDGEGVNMVWWGATVEEVFFSDGTHGKNGSLIGAAACILRYDAQYGFDVEVSHVIFTSRDAPLWDISECECFSWRRLNI